VPDNLFLTFSQRRFPDAAPTEESAAGQEEENGAAEEKENSLDEILQATLYEGDLDLPEPEPSAEEHPHATEQEESAVAVLPVGDEPEPVGKDSSATVAVGVQALVLGVIFASVVGFSLSGWSFQRGLFREAE